MKRIHDSFNQQGLMHLFNARLVSVDQGKVVISCPFSKELTQQHGFFHAGVLTSIADVACGYAAFTKMGVDDEVLSVEFNINFLKPAKTEMLYATGQVLQAGKKLIICEGSVFDATQEMLLARMIATMACVEKRP